MGANETRQETGGQLCPPSPATEDGHPALLTAPPSWEGPHVTETSSGLRQWEAGRSASVHPGLTPRGAAATSSQSAHQAPVTNVVSETLGERQPVSEPSQHKGTNKYEMHPRSCASALRPTTHPTRVNKPKQEHAKEDAPALRPLRGHQTEDRGAGNEARDVFK